MIEYINKRMNDWATWVKRRDDGGLGYRSEVNFLRLASSASSGPIIEDAAAVEIEGIMCRMKRDKPHRYQLAYWFYLAGDFPVARVAKELGCSRDTVYTRLHALHLDVMDELHEITIQAAERVPQNIFAKTA